MFLIIGNIISFIGFTVDYIFTLKFNKKSTIIKGNCLSTSISIVAYTFLKAYDGIVNCIITLIRLITIYLKDKYNKKWNFLFFVFIALYSLTFLCYAGIQTIILFTSTMCNFIPKWLSKDMQKIRIGGILSIILIIIYDVMIHNYMVIIVQVLNVIVFTIALIKWYKEDRYKNCN